MARNSMPITRRETAKYLGLAGLGGLAGCLGDDDNGDDDTDTSPGDDGDDGDAPLVEVGKASGEGTTGLIANAIQDEGLDAEQGFSMDLTMFTSPPEVQQQLVLNDDINVGYMGEVVATRNWAEGNQIQLVGPYMDYNAYVLVREEDDIEEPQDLAGRSINWASAEADAWLKTAIAFDIGYDVPPEELELNEVAPPASIELLADGELDSILLHEPLTTGALLNHDFEVLMHPGEVWTAETGLPLTTVDMAWEASWYEENQDIAEGVATAVREGQEYVHENLGDVLEQYQDFAGIQSEEHLESATERMPELFEVEWGEERRESGLAIAEYAYDIGLVDVEPTEDIYNVMDV